MVCFSNLSYGLDSFYLLYISYVFSSLMQLLGKDCYDIDIALDNMMGSEFVDKVREYLSSTGEEAQGLAVIPW